MKKIFTLIAVAAMTLTAGAQTWNFKVYNSENGYAESFAADKTALDAAVTVGTWELVSSKEGRYQTKYATANEELKAGETVLEISKGLFITGASGKFRIDAANNQFGFNGKDLAMRIKGLKTGQKISFVSRSASNSALDRYFEATTNLTVIEGFDVPVEGNPEKTNTATVTAEGDIVITSKVGGLNVLSITVFDVDGTEMTKEQVIAQGESYVAPREMTGNIITDSQTWICPQDMARNDELSDGVTMWEGIYLRGNTGSQAVKVETENVTTTLAGEEITVANVFNIASNQNLAPAPEASADVANSNATRMSIALNIGVAGKLYVCMRPSSLPDPARYAWIYRNGDKAFEKSTSDWKTKDVDGTAKPDYDIIEVENDGSGATYFIGGHIGLRVAAIKFVKATETPTAIETITHRETVGDNRWYTLGGQAITTPTKGIYVKNGKKVIIK